MIGYLSKFIPRYAVLTAPLKRLTRKDVPFAWGPEEDAAFQKLKNSITNDDTMAYLTPENQSLYGQRQVSMKDCRPACFKEQARDYNLCTTLAGQ